MSKTYFIAGTDTDVGKTFVAEALLWAAQQQGCSTLGLKPLAAGCEPSPEGLRNADALALMRASTVELPYAQVNPVALEPAIAPHIAAQQAGRRLQVDRLAGFIRGALLSARADFTVVEGAGGWLVPLSHRETLGDLAREINQPVILVVGMRLGCISHALLTVQAIRQAGLPLAGWVANQIDPAMSCYEENLATLKQMIVAPCLGALPFTDDGDARGLSSALDLSLLRA